MSYSSVPLKTLTVIRVYKTITNVPWQTLPNVLDDVKLAAKTSG